MSEQCDVCPFHEDMSKKVNVLWDWHIAYGVKFEEIRNKIGNTNKLLGGIIAALLLDVLTRIMGA